MNASTTSSSARLAVERWCNFYTQGLSAEAASERREELGADMLDQVDWARAHGHASGAIGRAIIWRALKGVPADLAWRHAQLRLADLPAFRTRLFNEWLLFAVTLLGLGLVALASTAIARVGREIFGRQDAFVMLTLVASLAIVCGLLLLVRTRTRPLGAVWIAVGAPVVATTGIELLARNTTLLLYASRASTTWGTAEAMIAASLAVFYLAAAVWWMPERGRATSR